jgi:hypothetical protein
MLPELLEYADGDFWVEAGKGVMGKILVAVQLMMWLSASMRKRLRLS